MKLSLWTQALAILLVLCNIQSLVEGQSLAQNGKVNFTGVYPDMLRCATVQYPRAFHGSRDVHVIVSVSHGEESSNVQDFAVAWTADVTTSSFRACVMESSPNKNGSTDLNWIAFQGTSSGMLEGTASLPTFASGTKCEIVNFAQRFSSIPQVMATVRHTVNKETKDAIYLWIEESKEDHFRVCLREVITFVGKHQDVAVDWVAVPQGADTFSFQGKTDFENTAAPLEQDNFAFCQVVNFTEVFHTPPTVIVIAHHHYNSTNAYSVKPENNVLSTWLEEITIESFRVCVKDLAGMESQHDPVTVDYAVIGDLDPCINISCTYFAVCKAFGPGDARCICVNECPSFEEPLCSSNGTTYDNKCKFQREMCHLQLNFTIFHPGGCTGFPSQKGHHQLQHSPYYAEVVCEQVSLSPYVFYPDKPVHIQVSVNHANFPDPAYVHEAAVAWVDNVLDDNFTVCVTQAGRNEKKNGKQFASVDWLAYQGAPDGGVSGEMEMPTWWTGTACRMVYFPSRKFQSAPTVFLSAKHEKRGVKHDAATVWVEDVTSTSSKICVRELQNFDGAHESIHIDWIAFEELHRPLFREHGAVYFSNGNKPSKDFNYAFCDDVVFKKVYKETPAVLVTANHSTNGRNLNPMYNSISAWIEYVNVSGFRACVKELFVNQHDPLSVSYAVMPDVCEPGWSFYNGSCYFTSEACDSWTNASRICRGKSANLATIESQEENVYVQQRHNGAKAWIGLNDIATEGFYTWVDGGPNRFRYWALNQPNNFKGEDCVHTLGVDQGYMWNDVHCSECHQYTCKKDYNDCTSTPCMNGGTCVNKRHTFSCICPGTHIGRTCEEINECSSNPCLNGGTCTDAVNNYTCACPSPFYGHRCQETDECQSNPCQNDGTCVDGINNFTCVCPSPFAGKRCTASPKVSCKSHQSAGENSSGTYYLNAAGSIFQAYCDMSANNGGWTLISRFSNADSAYWMQSSGSWWFDRTSSYGSVTSPSGNYDMISPAFWRVTGDIIKITRSDDSSNTALLYTTSGCIGGRTFRGFITRFGNFRNGQVWNSNACRGSCYSYFGGSYSSTGGFSQAGCSSNLQSNRYISFWCDWSTGDGAVMMIGGGGDSCSRADHGIGITEANEAQFGITDSHCSGGQCEDFGDATTKPSSYSLNLWIK